MILCECSKIARLHFSRQLKNPFVGCHNHNKSLNNKEKCEFELDLADQLMLNKLNARAGKKKLFYQIIIINNKFVIHVLFLLAIKHIFINNNSDISM